MFVAHRVDENVLIVPFDRIDMATFDVFPETAKRILELVRLVEGERRVVPAPGLLDESLQRRTPGIPQTGRAHEPQPRGVLDRAVQVAERQQKLSERGQA